MILKTRPTQVVILAGGRGTRLAPITNFKPKPMIQFHGKPFLEYLIEMVQEQGFDRILLLLGYMPEVIQEYFGDGSKWDVSIEYSISDVGNDTGRRLKLVEDRVDARFLLMYCDNYWPMQFDSMWHQYTASETVGLVTVYRNEDQYTRNNLRFDDQKYVVEYDKSRNALNLAGVDIGFMILPRELIRALPEDNFSFEEIVYPDLVARRELQAYITDHRYYSVGSYERLDATEEFLHRRPTVLLDRDGVLNRKMPVAEYVRSWDEWEWLPGSKAALRLFNEAGYQVIIITNQPGIARGVMTQTALESINFRMKDDARTAGGQIEHVYYCPHGWDDGCECRKPRPGLLFQAQKDYKLDLSRTYFIGDDDRDKEAALASGCLWLGVSESKPLLYLAKNLVLNNSL